MRTLLVMASVLLAMSSCDPRYVETSADVDIFLAQKRYSAACVALKNDKDESLRAYAAEKLSGYPEEQIATDCVCEALSPERLDGLDFASARGIGGTGRDDLVSCLSPALSDTTLSDEDRVLLVSLIAGVGAPVGFKAVAEVAKTDKNPAVRVAAILGLLTARVEYQEVILDRLANDEAPEVRAACAKVLEGVKDQEAVDALLKALDSDSDGGVRAACLKAVVKLRLPKTDEMVCKAMMDDPDERVRDRAVRSFRASKRPEALACLKNRLLTMEESTVVRKSTLEALGSSPSDKAALILCHAIGPFLRMYVVDSIAEKTPVVHIIETQNNRDFNRSYECVEKAIRQGGYSCYARNHLGLWMNELGGKAATPWCPGMVKNTP